MENRDLRSDDLRVISLTSDDMERSAWRSHPLLQAKKWSHPGYKQPRFAEHSIRVCGRCALVLPCSCCGCKATGDQHHCGELHVHDDVAVLTQFPRRRHRMYSTSSRRPSPRSTPKSTSRSSRTTRVSLRRRAIWPRSRRSCPRPRRGDSPLVPRCVGLVLHVCVRAQDQESAQQRQAVTGVSSTPRADARCSAAASRRA